VYTNCIYTYDYLTDLILKLSFCVLEAWQGTDAWTASVPADQSEVLAVDVIVDPEGNGGTML
jgi:hypothetical protein